MKISIEVGPQNMSIIQGTQTGNNLHIKNSVRVKMPPYIIKDGEILNVDLLHTTIKNALANNKITGSSIAININSTSIITRELIIPKTSPSNARRLITNEMFQARASTTQYIVDYAVTEAITDGKTTRHKVLAVAIPENIVKGYITLCDMLGFRKEYIDIQFNSIYKTFAIQPSIVAKEKPVIVANIGTSSAIFLVIEKGKIAFSKTVSLNIAKYMNLTSDKTTIDYSKVDLITAPTSSRQTLVNTFVYDIAQEISKIIQFEYSRSNYSTLSDIFLGGAITEVGGIEDRLSALLDTQIKVVTMPFCVKTKLNFKYSQYISVIGGLIRLKS